MKLIIGAVCAIGMLFGGMVLAAEDRAAASQPSANSSQPAPPKVEFFGVATEGCRVVYIIPHNGDVMDTFTAIRKELKRSVGSLLPGQEFAVLAYVETVEPVGPAGFRVATDIANRDFSGEVDKIPLEVQAETDYPAMQTAFNEAFSLKPDVIYFLTRQDWDEKLANVVKTRNTDGHVKVNVLAINDEIGDASAQKTTAVNGGQYKMVLVDRENVVLTTSMRDELRAATRAAASRSSTSAPAGTQAATDRQSASVQFFGLESKADSVVYVADFSGSLLDNIDLLKEGIKKSVANLGPTQSFAVVAFGEYAVVLGPAKLQPATPDARNDLNKRLDDLKGMHQNDDMLEPFRQAFTKAFAMKPQVIYFLTDGRFNPRVFDVVKDMNKDQKVKINAVAFVYEDPDYIAQMQKMAKDNGGIYKFVTEKDLTP